MVCQYGYWAVFMGITLKNTGIFIPGETINITGGVLAGSGYLNYWIVRGIATAGVVLGGNFGYWIGRLGGCAVLLTLCSVVADFCRTHAGN
ncbi:MAG: DedA family protein, partial [cyanobacterium endosymbiont of Rhopalodia fuxianensis]